LYILLLTGLALHLCFYGCAKRSREDVASNESDRETAIADNTLASFQSELLDVAFETASAMPVYPHIKDRSRAQEQVVNACLALGQLKSAVAFIERIENWRANLCYANLALYCAEHGHTSAAPKYLDFAARFPKEDEWRINRVRAIIARTYSLLGQSDQAKELIATLGSAETDHGVQAQAMIGRKDSFDEQINALDALISPGDFDRIRGGLNAYANLFDRFYEDTHRRSLLEEKIKTAWKKIPIIVRVELLMDLAGFALEHGDTSEALGLLNEAQSFMEASHWPLEHRVPKMAGLARLRFRVGDAEAARADCDAALALFNEQRENVIDIYRAGALRPLAEAYQAMGDTQTSLSVYKQVVEEGTANPNSRPRAQDLCATCCSMALAAVEPAPDLWTRIRQISEALSAPW
jgi:tetratricopeptide (TPR) repeat protein